VKQRELPWAHGDIVLTWRKRKNNTVKVRLYFYLSIWFSFNSVDLTQVFQACFNVLRSLRRCSSLWIVASWTFCVGEWNLTFPFLPPFWHLHHHPPRSLLKLITNSQVIQVTREQLGDHQWDPDHGKLYRTAQPVSSANKL
jgi:hypothetical protein